MTDFEKIKNMTEGETIFLNMFQDGGSQIHKYNYEFLLYEIPMYGGEPRFYGIYKNTDTQIEKMIETYQSWT